MRIQLLGAAFLFLVSACGPAGQAPEAATPSTASHPARAVWEADVECPKIGEQLDAIGVWATQAATDPPKTCMAIDVAGGNSAFITLGGGISDCSKMRFDDSTPLEQLHGLGVEACLATHVSSSTQAAAAIGVSFSDGRAIDVSCSSDRNGELSQVTAMCRSIAEAAIAGLEAP